MLWYVVGEIELRSWWGGEMVSMLSASGRKRKVLKDGMCRFRMTQGIRRDEKRQRPDFKSWGEEQIARLLEREGIRYQYEYPLAIVDGGKQRLYYPDFRLPDQGIVIEYFGLSGNKAYDEQMRHKLELYGREGIDGLFLTRDSLRGDWPRSIMGQIDDVLERRARQFRERCRNIDRRTETDGAVYA